MLFFPTPPFLFLLDVLCCLVSCHAVDSTPSHPHTHPAFTSTQPLSVRTLAANTYKPKKPSQTHANPPATLLSLVCPRHRPHHHHHHYPIPIPLHSHPSHLAKSPAEKKIVHPPSAQLWTLVRTSPADSFASFPTGFFSTPVATSVPTQLDSYRRKNGQPIASRPQIHRHHRPPRKNTAKPPKPHDAPHKRSHTAPTSNPPNPLFPPSTTQYRSDHAQTTSVTYRPDRPIRIHPPRQKTTPIPPAHPQKLEKTSFSHPTHPSLTPSLSILPPLHPPPSPHPTQKTSSFHPQHPSFAPTCPIQSLPHTTQRSLPITQNLVVTHFFSNSSHTTRPPHPHHKIIAIHIFHTSIPSLLLSAHRKNYAHPPNHHQTSHHGPQQVTHRPRTSISFRQKLKALAPSASSHGVVGLASDGARARLSLRLCPRAFPVASSQNTALTTTWKSERSAKNSQRLSNRSSVITLQYKRMYLTLAHKHISTAAGQPGDKGNLEFMSRCLDHIRLASVPLLG